MQDARKESKKDKESAEKALMENPQFQNPKFWAKIDPLLFQAVDSALDKANRHFKKSAIKQLKKQLAELESDK